MGKKGQVELSFGMIFSIILIVAIVVVAFYAISYFLEFRDCSGVGLFYNDLQNDINRGWGSDFSSESLSLNLPGNIDSVCFGNLSQVPADEDREIFTTIKNKGGSRANNVFVYPLVCDTLKSAAVEHMKTSEFFCADAANGKISVLMTKGREDALVTISKA